MINNGMVWGLVGSIIIVVLFYFIKDRGLIKKLHGVREVMDTAKEYSAFPRYMIFSDLSLNANQQLTPIMFASLYNSTIVGHYSLANRILRLPNIVITSSIANVFRNDAIDEIRIHNNCRDLYVSTLKKLFLISFPVYLFLFILSPFIFKFVFGSEWGLAGDFGRIISIFLFVEFIATPLNTLFYVRNKQRKLMILQTINLFFSILMIVIGATVFHNPKASLILFSINAILFNLILLVFSYKLSVKDI